MWSVINLILLIGWSYSIQTGKNISSNVSTQIYNKSHGLQSSLWLNHTDERETSINLISQKDMYCKMTIISLPENGKRKLMKG